MANVRQRGPTDQFTVGHIGFVGRQNGSRGPGPLIDIRVRQCKIPRQTIDVAQHTGPWPHGDGLNVVHFQDTMGIFRRQWIIAARTFHVVATVAHESSITHTGGGFVMVPGIVRVPPTHHVFVQFNATVRIER